MISGSPRKLITRQRVCRRRNASCPVNHSPISTKTSFFPSIERWCSSAAARSSWRRSHQRGLIHGACHTYVGQEAIAVGVCAHLRQDDVVFSTHRGHGHALAKGLAPRQLFAELFGRATGCSQGRGGSMHLFAPKSA